MSTVFHRHPAAPWVELRESHSAPHCFRLHMHAEYSIGIVDAGVTEFRHAGGPEPVRAGDVVLIEPGLWHACNPVPGARWSYRMLFVQADWVHAQLGVRALRFPARVLGGCAADAADRLCQPGRLPASAEDLLNLLRRHGEPASPLPGDSAVDAALRTLHARPESAPSVQALAEAAGMGAAQFIRRFKAATGVTPGVYRLNLRLNGARRLLAQGTPLADAAHAMGFADQAHMQRSFKAHHALTPGRYAFGGLNP
ncbi:MAG: AraC family transcriptional regulator [Acidovorax sp.]